MTKRLIRITTVPVSLHKLLGGQLAFMQKNDFEVLAVSADGPEVNDVKKEGIKHFVIPFTRSITPIQDLSCLVQLIRLFRKIKPDIVHTHTPKAGLLGMLAAWICRVPVRIHTVAGLPWMETTGIKRFVLKITERLTYFCAQHVYPNSAALLKFISHEFSINPDSGRFRKFHVIGRGSSNGIDVSFFSRNSMSEQKAATIRDQHKIPTAATVFSFAGRIVRDKGIVELIQAFQQINEDVYLLLIGQAEDHLDPLPGKIKNVIDQNPRIISAGFQEDIRPWLLASDIFVFPSYREGFPNVVMQASCLQIPCIVSDINGCNELIAHKNSGLIVPPKDTRTLLHAMTSLMMSKQQQREFAENAFNFISVNFNQQYIWNELLTKYNALTVRS
jgi:glycosyltransferase involved in cell wall biosynthesis